MDSSSIVSFNNDSTYQCTAKGDYNNFSVHELALHAMRDRCLLLQKRINSLESDNMKLRLDLTKIEDHSTYIPLQDNEKFTLQQKIAELTKQKSQLLHHVFMVACENKNLWTKVASIRSTERKHKELTKQPLIRTNTYIHSTPKLVSQEKCYEPSLEEISLKLINSYIQEKSQLVEQYEQMVELQEMDEKFDILNADSIGFTYMEDPVTDSLKEIQCQTEKLMGLKKEVAQQERDLKTLLTRIEIILRDGYKCSSCMSTYTEDKETEICSRSVNFGTQTDSMLMESILLDRDGFQEVHDNHKTIQLCDKICPMCGETFREDILFNRFQAHVESHFAAGKETEDSNSYLDIN
ncbi:unnamed protein product [Leptidea sinapis]|uniref:UBZ1-type domain-containing protein n=1 Tax=Leptidea sinapis TaxID=189913 RepID=A0A5E4QJZ6_9NEOP|nr:unnamed protein product [Leptidea sinapis]